MEQTLVRIYQREFCPGFPPQFAWPRLDGEGGGEGATGRRRPRARGSQQEQPEQRGYVEVRMSGGIWSL